MERWGNEHARRCTHRRPPRGPAADAAAGLRSAARSGSPVAAGTRLRAASGIGLRTPAERGLRPGALCGLRSACRAWLRSARRVGPGPPAAAPAYGQPPAYGPPTPYGQAPQGYAPPAPYGAAGGYGYPVKPPAGALSWGLGFLAYIPIPYIGIVIAGIVMACVYRSQSRKSPVAEGNARNAANWGLTIALLTVVCFLIALISGVGLGDSGAWIAGLMVVIWIAGCITHLVLIIMGLVRANRGAVLTVPFAIPFIRA